MLITLRQARCEDLELLNRIYTQNMKGYVEQVYPWNPGLFRERFVANDYTVVEIADTVVGFIKVVLAEIYLGEIQIQQKYQNQGIGTWLMGLIIQESERSGKKIWLKVLKGNPAENFYKKFGFKVVADLETHKKMERIPSRTAHSNDCWHTN